VVLRANERNARKGCEERDGPVSISVRDKL